MLIEASEMTACIDRISALEQAFIAKEKTEQEILQALYENNRLLLKLQHQPPQKPVRRDNVISINGSLFKDLL